MYLMKKPERTIDEIKRIEELYDYQILDTESEIEYEDIVKLASSICRTPIAVISLVDHERQWFKSIIGLDTKETSREVSFCGHAIHQNDIFEVENAKADDRFSDNPLVTGDVNIQFYAGAPSSLRLDQKLERFVSSEMNLKNYPLSKENH